MSFSTEKSPPGYCRGVWENGVRSQVPWVHKKISFVPFSRTGDLVVTRVPHNENVKGPNMSQKLRAEAQSMKTRLYAESMKEKEREPYVSTTRMGYHPNEQKSTYGAEYKEPPASCYTKEPPFQSAAASRAFAAMNSMMLDDLTTKQDFERDMRVYNSQQQLLSEGNGNLLKQQQQQPQFSPEYWPSKEPPAGIIPMPTLQGRRGKTPPQETSPIAPENVFDEMYGFQGPLMSDFTQRGTQRIGRMTGVI